MKVLLGKLNKKLSVLSTIVVVLVVLICHVFILEVDKDNNIKQDEHRDNIDRKYEKKEKKTQEYDRRSVIADPISIDYYIRIVISGQGNIGATIYKGDTDEVEKNSDILGCIDTSKIKQGVITITDLNIIISANYGICISDEISSGNASNINIVMAGTNSITVTSNSEKSYGVYFDSTNNANHSSTSLTIDGDGELDITVNNQSGSGYGIYTQIDNNLNIEVGDLTINSSSQGIYAGGGSCNINVPTGGSVNINGKTTDDFTTNAQGEIELNQSELEGLVPPWPDTYYLEFNVLNDVGTLYAVDGETRDNVMRKLPGTLLVDGTTLTLKDYVFPHSDNQTVALKITGTGNATLKLDGTNELKVNNGNAISVAADVNLTIESDTNGSLNIQRGTAGSLNIEGSTAGISAGGSVSITGGTVNATVNSLGSTAIEAGSSGLTIGAFGGDSTTPVVKVIRGNISDDPTNQNNEGIYSAGTINMLSGKVTIGDAAGYNFGIGILSNGNLNIANGTITSYGLYKGIASNGTMVISNGSVTGQTVASTGVTYAIYSAKTLTINNGVVNGIATSSTDSSHGIFSQNEMKIVDGEITAEVTAITASGIKVYSKGIVIGDSSNIQEGKEDIHGPIIRVKSHAPSNEQSSQGTGALQNEGIYAKGISYIYGGDIKVEGNYGNAIEVVSGGLNILGGIIDAYALHKGMWMEAGLNISGGYITLSTSDLKRVNTGIYAKKGSLIISGGVINCKAYGENARGIIGAEGASITISNGHITAEGNGYLGQAILVDEGNLSITGGTIKAIGSGSTCKGINVTKGNTVDGVIKGVDIQGGTIEVEATGNNGVGILVSTGSFNMSGGILNVAASNGTKVKGIDNENGSINISGGEVTVDAAGSTAYGIYNQKDELKIANGTVRVTANGNDARGIFNSTDTTELNIYSGSIYVNIYGLNARGLETKGTFTIGEKVGDQGPIIVVRGDINNTSNDYNDCAFYANDMIINAGYLNVELNSSDGTKGTNGITAVRVAGALTVNGGNLEAKANVLRTDGTYGKAHGMNVTGNMIINGGRVVCTTNGANTNDSGLYVDSTSTLTINGGDSKFANTNKNNVNGYGVKVNGQVMNVNAGYAIIQGAKQAIGCDAVNYIETTTDEAGNGTSVMARACGNYDGGGTFDIYDSDNNSSYKYVEFGVSYNYYINYTNGVMYKGDSGVAFTTDELGNMGISLDLDASKIIFNNIKFTSSSRYGLYADRAITIVLTENSVNEIDVTGEQGANETYGAIYSMGTVTIEGKGGLVLKANSQAINAISVSIGVDTDGELVVEKASSSYDGTSAQAYPDIIDWSGYKYVKITKLESYYFKYKADSGEMYRVVADGSSEIKLKNNNELVIGWSIELKDSEYSLVLDNFNFHTKAPYGIVVEGAGKIKLCNTNAIVSTEDNYSSYIGIFANDDLSLYGTGTLELVKSNDTDNKYTGINSGGDISITGGTYNIEDVGTSIVCNGDISITDSTCYLTANEYGLKVANASYVTVKDATIVATGTKEAISISSGCISNIYESVKVSAMYDGSSLVGIDDTNTRIINGNFKSSSGKYLYVEMNPVVLSVDIIWGECAYECEKVWNSSTHTYYDVWTVADGADKVKVTNAGSNIPVIATVSHNISESTGIIASFVGNRNSTDINTTVAETLDTMTNLFGGSNAGVLFKYFVLSGFPYQVYNNETVGNVTVTLESVCN